MNILPNLSFPERAPEGGYKWPNAQLWQRLNHQEKPASLGVYFPDNQAWTQKPKNRGAWGG